VASEDGGSVGRRSLDNPEAVFLSSSFPSSLSASAVRRKLSFNPYAGRGWTQSAADDTEEDRTSLLRSDFGSVTNISDLPSIRAAENPATAEIVLRDPNWNLAETTPAFEVSEGKRIGKGPHLII
jgi:hypothetical protein